MAGTIVYQGHTFCLLPSAFHNISGKEQQDSVKLNACGSAELEWQWDELTQTIRSWCIAISLSGDEISKKIYI